MLILAAVVVFASGANARDQGSEAIAFINANDLRADKVVPPDVRFVSSGQPDEAVLRAIADAGFSAIVDLRVPLVTCHGRAVGLLHDWQGGYAKTVSGYGERVQRSPIRPTAFDEPQWAVRIDL